MNTKNPALLKEGTTAMNRYEAATAILDLSAEGKPDHAKETAALSAPETKNAEFEKDSVSISSETPELF